MPRIEVRHTDPSHYGDKNNRTIDRMHDPSCLRFEQNERASVFDEIEAWPVPSTAYARQNYF